MVGSLNLAERQMVELAKTLNVQARLLLLDEPTSALNDQQAQALHRFARAGKEWRISAVCLSSTQRCIEPL